MKMIRVYYPDGETLVVTEDEAKVLRQSSRAASLMFEPIAPARVGQTEKDMLRELEAAHVIIRNALNIMTPEQKLEWAARNERVGVAGEGTTRANERGDVLEKARRQK